MQKKRTLATKKPKHNTIIGRGVTLFVEEQTFILTLHEERLGYRVIKEKMESRSQLSCK